MNEKGRSARGQVERALAGTAEGDVGGLSTGLDGAEILALGVEHLHAGDGG